MSCLLLLFAEISILKCSVKFEVSPEIVSGWSKRDATFNLITKIAVGGTIDHTVFMFAGFVHRNCVHQVCSQY